MCSAVPFGTFSFLTDPLRPQFSTWHQCRVMCEKLVTGWAVVCGERVLGVEKMGGGDWMILMEAARSDHAKNGLRSFRVAQKVKHAGRLGCAHKMVET